MIKVISFDLDDTLSDSNFDNLIWNVEIPRAYAQKKNISFEKAKEIVLKEYDDLYGKLKGDWRDATFWLKHFGLKITWEELLDNLKHEIKHFPEIKKVLKYFKEKNILVVIITSAERKFLEAKLECEGIRSFFDKTFSAPSDFGKDKKDAEVYKKVLEELKISSKEIIHVGDDKELDLEIPSSLGIKAVLIDREGKEENSIKDLTELKKLVK